MSFHRDLIAPERDNGVPRPAGVPPRAAYVVCSTPRSGSGLLCRALAATGVAAVPMEYFNGALRGELAARWGCGEGLDAYVRALWARRVDGDGLLGVKLHWQQLLDVCAERNEPAPSVADLREVLGVVLRCVRIRREDRDRQAVSLWIASQTGVWSVGVGVGAMAEPEVGFSLEGIERCRAEIEAGDAGWETLLRSAGLEVLDVSYEQLVAAYEETVRAVLAFVCPGAEVKSIAAPSTIRQSGMRADALLEQYRQERRRAS